MSEISQIPVEDVAVYKMAVHLYREYESIQEHDYNPELQKKLDDAIAALNLTVDVVENDIIVTYKLDRSVSNG